MSRSQGTPKTLTQAIWNGMISQRTADVFVDTDYLLARAIEEHVKDLIRQKFSVTYLMFDELVRDPVAEFLLKELAYQLGAEKQKPEPPKGKP